MRLNTWTLMKIVAGMISFVAGWFFLLATGPAQWWVFVLISVGATLLGFGVGDMIRMRHSGRRT